MVERLPEVPGAGPMTFQVDALNFGSAVFQTETEARPTGPNKPLFYRTPSVVVSPDYFLEISKMGQEMARKKTIPVPTGGGTPFQKTPINVLAAEHLANFGETTVDMGADYVPGTVFDSQEPKYTPAPPLPMPRKPEPGLAIATMLRRQG